DLDGAPILAFAFADVDDLDRTRHAGLNTGIIAQDHLGRAQAVEMRGPKAKLGARHGIGPEGRLHFQSNLQVFGGPLGCHGRSQVWSVPAQEPRALGKAYLFALRMGRLGSIVANTHDQLRMAPACGTMASWPCPFAICPKFKTGIAMAAAIAAAIRR